MSEPTRWCFARRSLTAKVSLPRAAAVRLRPAAAEALATLLPLLGCGEEAAALAFDRLADNDNPVAAAALRRIGDEELVHAALLDRLRAALPNPGDVAAMLRAARRFHIDLGRGGATLHLARIAALDAAVCTVLSRLTRAASPLSSDTSVVGLLTLIRADESRHVRVSRGLALARGDARLLRDAAAPARIALAQVLALAGDAFEALAVDPDALSRDLSRLPHGLFPA